MALDLGECAGPLQRGGGMEICSRCRLHLYVLGMWFLSAARLLLWCLATGGLAMGAAWTGRPVAFTDWPALGPPAWRGREGSRAMIALEAARGVAAMESWMRSGCPPPADQRGRDRGGQADAPD